MPPSVSLYKGMPLSVSSLSHLLLIYTGMMDAAYFIGRRELLDFFNTLLELNLTKIEETATGAVACQMTEMIFPGSIPMARVNWEARSDYEFVQNYKLLQNAFNKHNVQRYV
jgi:RP/EB family microtubule-associated protein